jgi:lysophospholipase L1-like esterase
VSNNFATSLVTNTPGTSGASVTVTTGTGSRFVTGKATVGPDATTWTPANAEVVTISGISTDTLTVTRGAESSTPMALAAGYRIVQGVTAAMYDALVTAVGTVGPMIPGIPVATNCFYQAQQGTIPNGSTGTNGTSRSKHRATAACADLVLVYGNATGGNSGETEGPNTYTVKAAIEWNGGTIVPATFRGSLTGTVAPGGTLVSDPLPVEFLKGTDFWVRTYATADGTTAVGGNTTANPSTGQGFAAGDLTAAGASAITDSYSFIYSPHAIFGRPTTANVPTVAIVGDSIACGSGDTAASSPVTEWANTTSAQAGGFMLRALARNFGYVHIAAGSEDSTQFAAKHRRAAIIGSAKYAVCQYGTNDVYGHALSAAACQAGLAKTWLICARRGLKVYQTTITPQTSSTDSWATTGNQTALSGNANRVTVNTWIRAGGPLDSTTLAPAAIGAANSIVAGQTGHPLLGYFETADTVETARNSGIWLVGKTADGVHPTTAGHVLMAAAINTALFV